MHLLIFQQEGNWFSQAGKTFLTVFLYKKNSPDVQTRWANHPCSQSLPQDKFG